LGIKRICKHLCKLFLSIPEEQSKSILRSIKRKIDGPLSTKHYNKKGLEVI